MFSSSFFSSVLLLNNWGNACSLIGKCITVYSLGLSVAQNQNCTSLKTFLQKLLLKLTLKDINYDIQIK